MGRMQTLIYLSQRSNLLLNEKKKVTSNFQVSVVYIDQHKKFLIVLREGFFWLASALNSTVFFCLIHWLEVSCRPTVFFPLSGSVQ